MEKIERKHFYRLNDSFYNFIVSVVLKDRNLMNTFYSENRHKIDYLTIYLFDASYSLFYSIKGDSDSETDPNFDMAFLVKSFQNFLSLFF